MRRAVILLVWLCASSMSGHAACDSGLAERLHAKLHPGRTLDHELAVCQAWRTVPGRSIVVLPLPLPRPGSKSGPTQFDVDILVVQQADNGNTDRAKVVSRLFEGRALTQDGRRIDDIRIDPGRYRLAEDVRAFGLRVRYQADSRANPYASETLSLYLPRGERLLKLLDGLELYRERGEWDTQCAGRFETVRGSLSLAPGTSQGYADLLLNRIHTEQVSRMEGDECVTQEQSARLSSTTLRHEGGNYRLPRSSAQD